MILVADTSGLLAALHSEDPEHARAAHALGAATTVLISPVMLCELDHVGTRALGRAGAAAAIDQLELWSRTERVVIPAVTADLLAEARGVRLQYASLALDLVDAVNVALAARYDTNEVLTLDHRDYRAIRPLGRHASFRLLPHDL